MSLADAKSPADKISISGPGLARPIEITDQQILQQFSPWDNKFYDLQKGALTVAPRTDRIYEVLMYTKENNNQPQVRYAFQYVPGQPGYIYLPGKGDTWYEVDIGTIIRGSMIEGHWFYASHGWGDLMGHLLGDKSLSITTSPLKSVSTGLSSFFEWLTFGVVFVLAGVLIWFFSRSHRRIA